MSEEGFITILALAGFAYAVYFIYSLVQGWEQGRAQGRQVAQAKAIERGEKPVGKPFGQAYGSAYLMHPRQISQNGLGFTIEKLQEKCQRLDMGFLLFGDVQYRKGNQVDHAMVAFEGPGHVMTIAPTRSGKGTCAVIPNILLYRGSIVVNDIKGENYAVTKIMRESSEHDVYKFAPFDDYSASWNPFDAFGEAEDAWDDARHMAELLITDSPGKDPFWNNGARNILTGLILHIAETAPAEKRNLSHLRDLLTQGQEEFEEMLAEMASEGSKIVARSANVFLRADSKVQSGILSTLDSELSFLDSERLARCTQTSDFHFRELKEKLTDVFLVIPPERLSTYAPFIRLFMGMAMLEMKRTKTKPDFPVLFMLDEFPALGRMKVIEEEITYLAGYDVKLWMFAQDLQQLASIYGDKVQSIIANCKVKQFFKVSDIETAKLVSAMCGNTTAPVISVSESSSVNVETKGTSMSGSARPLYDPNEVMNLAEGFQLIFFQGEQPILCVMTPYYQNDSLFKYNGQPIYSKNPYHS